MIACAKSCVIDLALLNLANSNNNLDRAVRPRTNKLNISRHLVNRNHIVVIKYCQNLLFLFTASIGFVLLLLAFAKCTIPREDDVTLKSTLLRV